MTISRSGKWLGATVVVLGGFVLLSGFGPNGVGRHFNPEKLDKFITFRVNDMLDDLNATPDQRTKVLAVKDKLLGDFMQNRESRQAARKAIIAQWNSDKPDAQAIHTAIDQQFDSMRALAHEAADQALQIHGILTPDQRAQVAKKFAHGGMMRE